MTWLDLCNDPKLQDLPYRIELNRAGQIIMSPTRNRHGYFASQIAQILAQLMKSGETLVECAIETADSTKVADVVWASDKIFSIIKDEISCSVAPEICVEVLSPANTPAEIAFKRDLYFRAGAKEYWVCDEEGGFKFFSAAGALQRSSICPEFPQHLDI
jgi:Uma2 family endonuclease